jgi:hypothetical protein
MPLKFDVAVKEPLPCMVKLLLTSTVTISFGFIALPPTKEPVMMFVPISSIMEFEGRNNPTPAEVSNEKLLRMRVLVVPHHAMPGRFTSNSGFILNPVALPVKVRITLSPSCANSP